MATDDETAWKPSLEYLAWLIPGARGACRSETGPPPSIFKLDDEPEPIAP